MILVRGMSMLALGALLQARPIERVYRLYFPHVQLLRDEQIREFTVDVACGHIEAITRIPNDWNVEVTRAVSAVETLHASAGHGASYVRGLDGFDGMAHIRPTDKQCFRVSAEVTAVFDVDRKLALSPTQLTLRP